MCGYGGCLCFGGDDGDWLVEIVNFVVCEEGFIDEDWILDVVVW